MTGQITQRNRGRGQPGNGNNEVQYQQDMKTQDLSQQWSKRRGIVLTDTWIVIVNYPLDICRCCDLGFSDYKISSLGKQLVKIFDIIFDRMRPSMLHYGSSADCSCLLCLPFACAAPSLSGYVTKLHPPDLGMYIYPLAIMR